MRFRALLLLWFALFAWALPAQAQSVAIPEVALSALPPEAAQTLALIRAGGPYPYKRDGITFFNRERLLPERPKGYYREFTVPTPGLKTRGAKRIVAGRGEEFYYTADHYRSFMRIRQ
ncbi:MAG: guanyl-specific ribonuclease Sa domain protein [Pseudomonadota bacterium]|jgi:ribonuclease T1